MSRLSPAAQRIVILTALALIPLIYASLLVWSVKDPTGDLETISAAIVDEDSPATTEDGDTLRLGEDLTDELLDSDEGFDWQTMTATEANEALADEDIRAILTIPSDFSAAAASLGEDDPMEAATSRLTITTDDASNVIVGNIASNVGEAVRSSVSQQVSEEFLAQVTVGFTDIAESLDEAADGAHELSDGTATAHSGAGDLVVGLDTLTDGAHDLSDGASRLAAGSATAADGAGQLADGLGELDEKTSTLPGSARTIDDGANDLAGGIRDLADGADDLANGIRTAASGADDLATGADDALSGAQDVDSGAQSLAGSTGGLADGAGAVADGSSTLLENWDLLSDAQRKAALEEVAQGAGDVSDGASAVDDGAQSLAGGTSSLIGTAPSEGTPTGLNALADGVGGLRDGIDDARDGADRLADGGDLLRDGADRLTDGTGQLVDGADQLAGATSTAATASADLSDGVSALADGAAELDDGTTQLASGAGDARTGAGDLETGLDDLDEGAGELATGLNDGRDEVPTYTDEEGDHLSTTASDPVGLEEDRAHEVAGYGWGLAPYFMSLALWVGAMSYFIMRPALNPRRIVTSSRLRAVIATLAPSVAMSVVQSTLMVTLVRLGVGIDMASTAGVYALSFFVSLCFFLINQMLIAAFGPPGRFLALVLIVLQLSAAGGTYPIETAPAFLQRLHGWLPLTHSVDGMRSLIAGGPFDTAGVLVPLGVWTAVALAGLFVTIGVVARKARRTVGHRRVDGPESVDGAEAVAVPVGADSVETSEAPEGEDHGEAQAHRMKPEPEPDADTAAAETGGETVPEATSASDVRETGSDDADDAARAAGRVSRH